MEEEKYKCPLCHVTHNNLSNEFKNINTFKEGNNLCSTCIKKIFNEENNLMFPQDLFIHRISEIEEEKESDNNNDTRKTEKNEIRHELNKSIIDEIKRDSINKTLIQEIKHQNNNKVLITNLKSPQCIKKDNNFKNHLNLSYHSKSYKNLNRIKNYYIKKTVKVNNYSNEKEFSENNNELDNIYINIEKNENIFNNFNQKFYNLIENINDNFIQMEGKIAEIKKEIINNINNQFTSILNFINLRRKEIFDKFQYCNYDISDLINSSLTWMKEVKEEKNELNVTNLIIKGKEIDNKFNFIKEINEIFKLLERYKENGLNITKNEYNEMPVIIHENTEIIKLLNLTPYNNDISKERNKIKSNENSEINNNSSTNIESSKIYCKKIIEDKIRHNNTVSDFYQNKNKRSFKSMKQQQNSIVNNHSINFNNRISVSRIKNEIINNTESNESTLPFLYSSASTNAINSGIKNYEKNKNNFLEYKKRHESIQVNNETDNNININFNGHIFNYNSDSNISIIFPEKNKNKNNKKKVGKNIDKNKRKTPHKIGIKNKLEKSNLKKNFSFNDNINQDTNKYIKINKVKNSPFSSNSNANIINNINKKFMKPSTKELKINNFHEKTFVSLTRNKNNKKSKNSNYKTLNNKELEKYVNYQLKKTKKNFSRINLNDYGIQLICSYFKKSKNKVYKEIKLQGCNLNDNDLELLIQCFNENNITIPVINISENELTDSCLDSIIEYLNDNDEITNIILTNNSFSKQAKNRLKEFAKNRKEELIEFNIQL